MEPDDMFDGLTENPYDAEARKLYGNDVTDEGFRQNIGQGDDELVTYLAEGMKVYAARNLSPPA